MDIPVLPRRPRSDYINAPSRIARRTSAKRRGWYAGWPDACPTEAARDDAIVIRPQDGKVFSPSVDLRLVELYQLWLTYSQELGYPLIGAMEENVRGGKQGGVGSFYCRAIKGSNPPAPSNHSTGTAVDVYTRSNPQIWGTPARFVSTIHPHMVELAAAADLYWGGWYWDADHAYVDAMHFEYMAKPADVAASTERLKKKRAEIKKRLAPQEPENDVTPEQVKLLQTTLNNLGASPPLVVDGDFGPITEGALKALPQRWADQIDAAESGTANEVVDTIVQTAEALRPAA